MEVLNNGAYWSRTSGLCPNGENGATTECDFSGLGLTDEAKEMTANVVWNLGGRANYNAITSEFYLDERGATVYEGRPTEWTGKVGLMYPSDYGYAVGGDVRNTCLEIELWNYRTNNCYTNDWLHNKTTPNQLTIMPTNNVSNGIFYVYEYGGIVNYNTGWLFYVNPSLFLISNIKFISGDGSKDNPYKLSAQI